MTAALEAMEKGADVLIVGKGAVGKGTCTSLAGGIFSLSSDQFTPEEHYQATMEVGRGLNDPRFVELVVNGARSNMDRLKEMGVPLLDYPRGCLVNNQGNQRDIPGMALVESMKEIMEARGIKSLPGFNCLELLVEDGRVAGILGLTAQGEPAVISAPSVVLATGGAGAIYQRHDNPGGITGDGYAMALKAGVQLQDMEFVQFYPVGLAQPGLPEFIIYPPYPGEARVYDSQGRDAFEELEGCEDLNQAIMIFRDTASLHFYRKHMEGGLFLDLTEVEESTWEALYSLRLLGKQSYDFSTQRVRIAPITHFFIGGTVVNTQMETSLPGLFAAGEVAGGFHGANRMGGNALTECVVCGTIAGARAAEYAGDSSRVEISGSRAEDALPDWAHRKEGSVRPEYNELFNSIKMTAWENAGVIRSKEGMQEGLQSVARLKADLEALVPAGVAEGLRHNRANSALLTLRCILEAGLRREESRGALYREDFPETDDANWRRNILISLDGSTGDLVLKEKPLIS
jgi:succinate dehydrogenase/fumarate reductase flavoprotein subunit